MLKFFAHLKPAMSDKAVLLDLENNTPSLSLLREVIQHYPVVYVFNTTGKFEFALEDLTEFAAWITSGQVVILEVGKAEYKEYQYAMVVGQLMALLPPTAHVEIISAMDSSPMLLELLKSSDISANLIQIQAESLEYESTNKIKLPSVSRIQSEPQLLLVKQYCDALAKMTGKPNTLEKLKNSLMNVLQVSKQQAQNLVGMLINLKLVKSEHEQIYFRKKVLKQWVQLNLEQEHQEHTAMQHLNGVVKHLEQDAQEKSQTQAVTEKAPNIYSVQKELFKNFSTIDPVQIEVARRLRELKDNKPKDIYELRDLLEQLFPKADIRLLLKELIEKGYIYWDGHEVIYSHEMFLN